MEGLIKHTPYVELYCLTPSASIIILWGPLITKVLFHTRCLNRRLGQWQCELCGTRSCRQHFPWRRQQFWRHLFLLRRVCARVWGSSASMCERQLHWESTTVCLWVGLCVIFCTLHMVKVTVVEVSAVSEWFLVVLTYKSTRNHSETADTSTPCDLNLMQSAKERWGHKIFVIIYFVTITVKRGMNLLMLPHRISKEI